MGTASLENNDIRSNFVCVYVLLYIWEKQANKHYIV